MTYRFSLAALLLVFSGVSQVRAEDLDSLRMEYNFNARWRMHVGDGAFERPGFDDSDWEAVALPRAWNEDEAFAVDIHRHSTGIDGPRARRAHAGRDA